MKKELVLNKKQTKELVKELEQEIAQENIEKVKSKIKQLIKEIKMTEILLDKKKKHLDDLLSGKNTYTEEDVLYDRI